MKQDPDHPATPPTATPDPLHCGGCDGFIPDVDGTEQNCHGVLAAARRKPPAGLDAPLTADTIAARALYATGGNEWTPTGATMTTPKPSLRDEPVARLRAALGALHPSARYIRVEAIDLRAALAESESPALTSLGLDTSMTLDDAFMLGYKNGEADEQSRQNNRTPRPKSCGQCGETAPHTDTLGREGDSYDTIIPHSWDGTTLTIFTEITKEEYFKGFEKTEQGYNG